MALGLVAVAFGGEGLLNLSTLPGIAEGGTAFRVERVALPVEAFIAFGLVPFRPLGFGFVCHKEGRCHFARWLQHIVTQRLFVAASA